MPYKHSHHTTSTSRPGLNARRRAARSSVTAARTRRSLGGLPASRASLSSSIGTLLETLHDFIVEALIHGRIVYVGVRQGQTRPVSAHIFFMWHACDTESTGFLNVSVADDESRLRCNEIGVAKLGKIATRLTQVKSPETIRPAAVTQALGTLVSRLPHICCKLEWQFITNRGGMDHS